VQFKGLVPFGGPERRYNRGQFWISEKYSSHIPIAECIDIWYEALPWDKEIQVCANKVPGVINDPTPRGHSFV